MENKVSVIIPTYNAKNYIDRCVQSVLSQSYQNFELIIVDDGSTDGTINILENYETNYKDKIKIFKQKNSGVAVARNKGIELATGRYVMFIDNDDYIDNDYIKMFVNEIMEYSFDIVMGGYRRPNSNGKIIEKVKLKQNELSKVKITAPWAKIYDRMYLLKNNIKFLECNIGDDVFFNLKAVTFTDKIRIMDYIGYNWYYNEKSVSNVAHRKMNDNLEFDYMLDSCYSIMNDNEYKKENNKIMEFYFIKQITWYLVYSGKNADTSYIAEKMIFLNKWLSDKFPNFAKNEFIKFKVDSFKIIMAMKLIVFAMKSNNEKKFVKIYKMFYK